MFVPNIVSEMEECFWNKVLAKMSRLKQRDGFVLALLLFSLLVCSSCVDCVAKKSNCNQLGGVRVNMVVIFIESIQTVTSIVYGLTNMQEVKKHLVSVKMVTKNVFTRCTLNIAK